ncbi:MAG: hypothetical protein AB1782_16710 [Cyanobacteriota bacterium]
MPNIHNNAIAERGKVNRSMKPMGTENESNGLGSAGYFAIEEESNESTSGYFIERSDELMNSLNRLAAINSSSLFVKNPFKR